MASDKQIAANRANALKSTGPVTPEGKARSSKNARKLGLFIADTILPQEDPQEFADIICGYNAEYSPLTPIEHELVNDLALATFKKRRYNRMETATLWRDEPGDTRIEATKQIAYHADRKDWTSILRAQAQAERDFLRTYKILEERKRQHPAPREVPQEIEIQVNLQHEPRLPAPKAILQNKPNQPAAAPPKGANSARSNDSSKLTG